MSVKFQITLPESLFTELRLEAGRRDIPVAEFIRNTMRRELKADRKRVNEAGPLAWLDQIQVDDEPDVSSRIDEILYGE
jgi:hypothetical protein